MTFLSKLGSILLKATGIITGFAPLFTASIPGTKDDKIVGTVISDLQQVGSVVAQAEAFGQALSLTGAQKLTAAAGPAAQVILQSALLAGKKIANEELFKQGSQKVASGIADILNSIHPDDVNEIKPQDNK